MRALPGDLGDCLVLNTLMAARALLRRYDAELRPFGVSVPQFMVLALVRGNTGVPVSHLAERIAMERTGLTRTLNLLERRGLVRREGGSGNARLCALTAEGDALLDRLLPEWRRAQAEIAGKLGGVDAAAYLEATRRLVAG